MRPEEVHEVLEKFFNKHYEFYGRQLDVQYTRTPFYGSRRMTAWLRSKSGQTMRPSSARRDPPPAARM